MWQLSRQRIARRTRELPDVALLVNRLAVLVGRNPPACSKVRRIFPEKGRLPMSACFRGSAVAQAKGEMRTDRHGSRSSCPAEQLLSVREQNAIDGGPATMNMGRLRFSPLSGLLT
jgi:hypothetical protein